MTVLSYSTMVNIYYLILFYIIYITDITRLVRLRYHCVAGDTSAPSLSATSCANYHPSELEHRISPVCGTEIYSHVDDFGLGPVSKNCGPTSQKAVSGQCKTRRVCLTRFRLVQISSATVMCSRGDGEFLHCCLVGDGLSPPSSHPGCGSNRKAAHRDLRRGACFTAQTAKLKQDDETAID